MRLVAPLVLLGAAVAAGPCAPARAQQKSIRINREFLTAPDPTAQSDSIAFSEGVSEREQLREMAVQWHQGIQEGNTAEAGDLVPQMKEILAGDGWKDKRTLLGAFLAMGKEWTLASDPEKAERAYRSALELEPHHAPTHLALGELAWEKNHGLAGGAGLVAGVVQATRVSLRDAVGRIRVLSNLALVLLAAAALSAAGFALVLMVKYNRLLRHGAQEALAERVPEGIDRVLAWALVFVPLILFLGPAWWVVWWLVMLQPYGTAAERRLSILALVVVALVPPAAHVVGRLGGLTKDPVVRATSALEDNDASPEVIAGIEALAQEAQGEDKQSALFLLARLQQVAGRHDEAVATYNRILEANPQHARSIVNRANVHFRRGDRPSAIADYKLATDADKDFALAWRNGSIAQAQELRTELATEWLRQAQRIDDDAVETWNEERGPDIVADSEPSQAELVALIRTEHVGGLRDLGASLLSPVTIGAVLGLGAVLWRSRRGLATLEAAACEKCGRAFCSRCHAAAKASAYCTQCVHLYVKKDGVSPVVRAAKLREVEKWVAVNSIAIRFFNILLPGAGSLYGNRVLTGSLLLFTWSAALVALLLPAYLLVAPERLGYADAVVAFGLEILLLLTCYLVALFQSLRHAG